jgi:putative peptidoglycan lipid II flippase
MSAAPGTAALPIEVRPGAPSAAGAAPAGANSYATARATTVLSGLALASPAAGLVFEVTLAWRFGTSPSVDAFRVAALLLTFGQQLFVFQILPHIVVPVFTEYRAAGRDTEGWHVALSLANLLTVPALLISLAAFLWPERIVDLLAPGLAGESHAATALFLRWFLLAYAPMVWSGVAAGILYSYRIFWLPPAVQFANNVILVLSILAFGSRLGGVSLVLGVLVSCALGLALYSSRLLPLMRQTGARFPWRFNVGHPGVRKALRMALPLLGMVLLMQWGCVVVNRALSRLPSGSLAEFGYVWKMGALVLFVPLSLSTVLFPRFSEARFGSAGDEFREICTRALRMVLFLSIPLACWFAVLRAPVVTLLYKHGAFSADAAATAARLFGLLVLASPAFAAYCSMEKMLYALGKTHIPMLAQLASAALLTTLCGVTARQFGIEGLMMLAGLIVCSVVSAGLFLVLQRRYQAFRWREVVRSTLRVLALAAASAGIVWQTSLLLERVGAPAVFSAALQTLGGLAAGASVFAAASLVLQVPEALACARYLRWAGDSVARRMQNGLHL